MEGAKDGIKSTLLIIPPLIGLIVSISMVKASGALDIFTCAIAPLTNSVGIPEKTIPLMILRPISGSGSMAIINNIFSQSGPDSFIGKVASTMMGSTETTFYAIAVYFGSVNIKNTRHTIPAALCADFSGFLMSVLTVKFLFFRN
jgi:spore maturation protein B